MFDINTFDAGTFDFGAAFSPGPPPPQPIPAGFSAEKVLSINTAPFVTPAKPLQNPFLPSIVNVGDSFALMVGAGQNLNPQTTYTIFITKPDGSQFFATAPQVYTAEVDSFVRQGLFFAQNYVALLIPGSFVDQHGYWQVTLQSLSSTSLPQRFYIGPPEVLT